MKYNFAIIEDNLEIRKTLSDYFAKSELLECVMAVDTVEKFLKFHRDFLEIKLILLDVMLYNQSSIYHISKILQREPEAEIIMFTIHEDTATIFQALTNGATGYLLKDIPIPELEQSLYSVLSGEGALLNPAIAKKIISYFSGSSPSSKTSVADKTLTKKEIIVVNFLKDGRSYKEIATQMGLSVNGVRYYIKSVYKKLQVSSRGELLRKKYLGTRKQ